MGATEFDEVIHF